MPQVKNQQRTAKSRGKGMKLAVSNGPQAPPVFEFIGEVKPDDAAIATIAKLGDKDAAKGARSRLRLAGKRRAAKQVTSRRRMAGEGRWPLDLVGGHSGVLVLQVWEGAGLERYGLADRDFVIIGIGDPEEGAPAFASINDKAVIGWYRSHPDGRISITPFVEGTPELTAPPREVQVVCALRAMARAGSWAFLKLPEP